MEILFSSALFLLVVLGFTAMGMKFWVRPKEAMDRVTGVVVNRDKPPVHPSLIFRELIEKLGSALPASPKDVNVMERRLIRAGFRSANALKILIGARAAGLVAFPLLAALAVSGAAIEYNHKVIAVLAAGVLGFLGPNEYVKQVSKRRQKQVSKGLPNALDLLVVCVESGLGLDQAVLQVAKELEHAFPVISQEFGLVNLEMKAGKRRVDALRNLADRTSVNDLKKLVNVLIQADRFGTGIAQSLRGHSEYMRVQTRQVAEEKAAKLGVKLVFPIFFCILPSLFVITVGPVAMRIVRELIPMMNSI